ncbi:hypothetical protein [Bradyrhizobium hereditatis]|uniref:hypothetical protein n=1 Tax=Bradyrhizobium hereditatis TaxID=2821405 RepID=UPI001CE25867|nr:hypothetical protein [Bradyrhizobium hereditatis]
MVYHLNDIDKVSFVLGNIQTHLDAVSGADHVTIALVVHGRFIRLRPIPTCEGGWPILQCRPRTRRLCQQHEIAERHVEGCVAAERGVMARIAIARLSPLAALRRQKLT